nr:uncharacterized protein CI109_007268 [Kwoniella shandongensis]KAA5524392.1 hypothetical protein CI109_007268 [Kwoniella shandongensis]
MATNSSKIDQYLEEKRQGLNRVDPRTAFERSQSHDGTVIIDTRPEAYRAAEGAIPGAIIIERNVLEWRLDPTSTANIPEARQPGFAPIIVCNEGYASSLAAQVLKDLGVDRATDLVGGFRAWKAEGLPVELKE